MFRWRYLYISILATLSLATCLSTLTASASQPTPTPIPEQASPQQSNSDQVTPEQSSPSQKALQTFDPTSHPTIHITQTQTAPTIDGRIDENEWQSAVLFDNFIQVDPNEGAAPTERTEVRMMYDADHLYIAVRCFDRFPEQIVAVTVHQFQRHSPR